MFEVKWIKVALIGSALIVCVSIGIGIGVSSKSRIEERKHGNIDLSDSTKTLANSTSTVVEKKVKEYLISDTGSSTSGADILDEISDDPCDGRGNRMLRTTNRKLYGISTAVSFTHHLLNY